MTLYETIYERKSIRNYKQDRISGEVLNRILEYEKELLPYYPEINVKMEIIGEADIKKHFTGVLNVKAPYYLAIHSEEKEGDMINAGYLMEQMALYINSIELGTCFLGGAYAKKQKKADSPYSFVVLLAFGITNENLYRKSVMAKRLKLQELCIFKNEASRDLKTILEAARLAPSWLNGQPWRFVVYDNRFHIFQKKSILPLDVVRKRNEFDIGVMLAHVMLAAEELWVDITVKRLENISHKSIPNNHYITSVILK